MKIAILFLASLWTAMAHAQLANLPDLVNPMPIGRVLLYPSVQPYSWLVPTAFRSEFSCTNNSGEFRTCSLSIYNELNSQEQAEMDRLSGQGLNIVPVSSLDDRVVGQIQEQFEMLTQLNGQSRSSQSLALSSGKFAYASNMFRVKRELATELLAAYSSAGLGAFKVNFILHGQRTETYLAVKDGACLQQQLGNIQDGLSLSPLNKMLEKVLSTCGLLWANFSADEVGPYAKVQLRAAFFDYSLWNGFSLRRQEVKQIGASYVMARSVEEPKQLRCQANLPLMQDAQVSTHCEELK